MKHNLTFFIVLALFPGIPASSANDAESIEFVTVGNPGNAADPASDSLYGAVNYVYRIAKNETTIAQYAEFLNAVAKTDSYDLYSSGMSRSENNGISRIGTSGNFTYTVNPGSEHKPIAYVNWFDAARFCNWLHNGRKTGEGAVITLETGAYTLNGAVSGIITKNEDARFWIPSENEWYKAAYYDPTKNGGVGGYWVYATKIDTNLTNDIGAVGAANYIDSEGYAIHRGGDTLGITDCGAYGANSVSYYGTNDQSGNLEEWTDAIISESRGRRGGSWKMAKGYLSSSSKFRIGAPPNHNINMGFRVASSTKP